MAQHHFFREGLLLMNEFKVHRRQTNPNSKGSMPRARGKLPVEGDLVKRIFLPENDLFIDFGCKQHFTLNNKLSTDREQLLTVEDTYPTFRADLENGAFSIRRTKKNFSRTPIDLTLEQTQNADAANSLTGFTCFTNSISARQRWSRTHSSHTELISRLYGRLNIMKKYDVTRDLRPYNIAKDRTWRGDQLYTQQLESLHTRGKRVTFGQYQHRKSGKRSDIWVFDKRPINWKQISRQIHRRVRRKSLSLWKTNHKGKSLFFCQGWSQVLKSQADGKVVELKMERDLMGRLLCIALENKVDMAEILSYPLTPVPLCFSHLDGSMYVCIFLYVDFIEINIVLYY